VCAIDPKNSDVVGQAGIFLLATQLVLMVGWLVDPQQEQKITPAAC
jgi:hypothetical protein